MSGPPPSYAAPSAPPGGYAQQSAPAAYGVAAPTPSRGPSHAGPGDVTPSAVSSTMREQPRSSRGWIWVVVLAPIAALIGAGLVLAVLKLLAPSPSPEPVVAPPPQQQQMFVPTPMPPAPIPSTAPVPGAEAPAPVPDPAPDPAPDPDSVPAPASGPVGVVIHEPFVVGETDSVAFNRVFAAARADVATCATTRATTVRVQFFVNAHGGIDLASPDVDNHGPPDVARCVVAQIRHHIPDHWSPGDGIVKVDVDLPASR
jgi:hypothetical protein